MGEIEALSRRLARGLGLALPEAGEAAFDPPWLHPLLEDLRRHGAHSLVLAGAEQPAPVQRLVCAINAKLGALGTTLSYTASPLLESNGGLAELSQALHAGEIETLLILDANPVYTAPADLRFDEALQRAGTSIHLGLYVDETARRCEWHLPQAHPLETWGDLRAGDGTAAIQQPVIAPIHGGRSAHELLDALLQEMPRSGYQRVREHWRGVFPEHAFEAHWQRALRHGVIEDSALPAVPVQLREDWQQGLEPAAGARASGLDLLFRPDATVYDGRFANNAWLQELPKPLSKLVWDNAALIAPATAARLGLADGEVVRLRRGGRELEVPVWRLPGQAEESLTLPLGYGRRRGGRIGIGLGFDANALRTGERPGFITGAVLETTGRRQRLVTTQHHQSMEGRELLRSATLAAYRTSLGEGEPEQTPPTLYPRHSSGEHAWGMSIDLNACIGCGACTLACQAENNIPVVGRQEVARGREMHWIRIDRYFEGAPAAPRTRFQPVPCMHCEQAPCELVCPVAATLHDAEGLNLQVYNRCIGTRFCSNNCPYKVRRFNFLQYAPQDAPALAARRNPQVTVRQRGVMEKCTYCLQRINAARLQAKQSGQALRDGDVVTACQGACPSRAIVFGDLNDSHSRVVRAKASRRDYTLLQELNTRPRTTYRLRLSHPNPRLEET
jgi:molybdopterin-containing oxidoreductase family iron-sulfur binding subunit